MRRLVTTFKFLGSAALFLLAVLLIASALPGGGWKALSVQTGSMRPAIEPGDLVLVHRVPASELQIGNVITYINPANSKQTITHRIIEINGPQLTVKGDANDTADITPVATRDVVGKVIAFVPKAGYVVNFVGSPLGLIALIYIPALIIVVREIRLLSVYYRRQQLYASQVIDSGLGPKVSSLKRRLIRVSKFTIILVLASLIIAVPVHAVLTSQVTLTGNTISAIRPVSHILIKSVTFGCSADNDPTGNRLAEIIFFNPAGSDTATGNWTVRANGRTVVTFRPQTVFDARSDYDIEPDIPLNQLGWQYTGDALAIFDSTGNLVDGISWGTDTSQLNPSLPPIFDGTKFSRNSTIVDTDTSSDWSVSSEPCATD